MLKAQFLPQLKRWASLRNLFVRFTAFHKRYVETLEVFHDSAWTLIATDQRKRLQNAVVGEIGREIRDKNNKEK